jgi:hypothetical protein
MNKREYCESRESVAYYSGLNGLEIKGIEYGIDDFVYCVSGCWYGGKAARRFHRCKIYYPANGKDSALKSRVAVAIAAYENGDKNAIKEYYRQSATLETLQNPVVKIGGWAFSLREFCRVYWVKSRYYGIMELYAPNKSAIYAVLGRYHVLKIVEV